MRALLSVIMVTLILVGLGVNVYGEHVKDNVTMFINDRLDMLDHGGADSLEARNELQMKDILKCQSGSMYKNFIEPYTKAACDKIMLDYESSCDCVS